MKTANYIKSKGIIYGASTNQFGESAIYAFTTVQAAEKWLHTEEYDFRSRELLSESKATKLAGRKATQYAKENAIA